MHATAEIQLTYRLVRQMVVDTIGKPGRRVRIGGVVLLVLQTLLGLVGGFGTQAIVMIAVGVLLITIPDLLTLLSWIPQRKIMATPVRYEISAVGVLIGTPSSRTEVAWPGISQIRFGKHAWLFKHGAAQLSVPRIAFGPEEQRSIDQFLAARAA